MTQTGEPISSPEFSVSMLFCIEEMVTSLGDGKLTEPYPLNEYTCNKFREFRGSIRMRNSNAASGWLTYGRIILIMEGLMSASFVYLDGEIYNSQFEAWIPDDPPNVQVVVGDWEIDASSMSKKKVLPQSSRLK